MSQAPQLSPQFLYGTAWKEDLTELCVMDALKSGFRAIDTANQRKHYYEEGVGLALKKAYGTMGLRRTEVFIQSKFTFARGQDHRKPYDEDAVIGAQVEQSFESSLQHLNTDYLDSYLLHGPSASVGLHETDWQAWSAMEALSRQGRAKHLGISNINIDQLVELCGRAEVKPSFVQNRCFAETQWDKQIREFCKANEIFYQGFSLLTANWRFLGGSLERPPGRNIPQLEFEGGQDHAVGSDFRRVLNEVKRTTQQVIFRFAQQVGMIPLVGTRSPRHMLEDLAISDFSLTLEQIEVIENIAIL